MTRGHRLMLDFALFAFEALEQGRELADFPAQCEDMGFFAAERSFEILYLTHDVSQFALHRERSFRALLAACNSDIVEAFTRLREEEGVRIFERQIAGRIRLGNDVTVA